MTPEQFVIWFRGFAEAANSYNITPKQWEAVKEMLAQVGSKTDATRTVEYNLHTNSDSTGKLLLTDNRIL